MKVLYNDIFEVEIFEGIECEAMGRITDDLLEGACRIIKNEKGIPTLYIPGHMLEDESSYPDGVTLNPELKLYLIKNEFDEIRIESEEDFQANYMILSELKNHLTKEGLNQLPEK